MEKRIQIPDTDLAVYPIGLGTGGAGLERESGAAERVFDTYLDCGGNLVDTAHVYSDWVPGERARSERVIGDWLAKSGKRNRIVLMTKGGHPEIAEGAPNRGQSRMTRADMRTDLEDSLRKLRTGARRWRGKSRPWKTSCGRARYVTTRALTGMRTGCWRRWLTAARKAIGDSWRTRAC